MDTLNIIFAFAAFSLMIANLGGAKQGLKTKVGNAILKPKSVLQVLPSWIAAIVVVLQVLGIFEIGTLDYTQYPPTTVFRLVGLAFFIVCGILQVSAFQSLGASYSTEAVILKGHHLQTGKWYRWIRHPQYFFQLLSDIGAGLALGSWLVLPVVLLAELPALMMRARLEEKILQSHFGNAYTDYKKKSGFFFPFIG